MAKAHRSSRKSSSPGKRSFPSKKLKSAKKRMSNRKAGGVPTSDTLKPSFKRRKRASRLQSKKHIGNSIKSKAMVSTSVIDPSASIVGIRARPASSAALQAGLPSGFRKDRVGRLLAYAITKLSEDGGDVKSLAAHLGAEAPGGGRPEDALIPVIIKLTTRPPNTNESYAHYKERIEEHLSPVRNKIKHLMGIEATPLITANSLKFKGSVQQIEELTKENKIERIELDPILQLASMDDTSRISAGQSSRYVYLCEMGGG